MKKTNQLLLVLFCNSLLFATCKKDTINSGIGEPSSLSIEFDHIAGGQNLVLNTGTYRNAAGESFSIDLLQYYISNIRLRKTDGSWYQLPTDSSYFLVKEGTAGSDPIKLTVPSADYDQLQFVLGVDSLRNTLEISQRTGVLDPAGDIGSGMYWSWNSGYIFFKMEGLSPDAPADPAGLHKFRFHIGGYGGYSTATLNNIKTITIDLSANGIAQPRPGRKSNIHLLVDLLKVFDGTPAISIKDHPTVMFSPFSVTIADNFSRLFTHDHSEN